MQNAKELTFPEIEYDESGKVVGHPSWMTEAQFKKIPVRWTIRRKSAVVFAFKKNILTILWIEDFLEIGRDELFEWCRAIRKGGAQALRVTRR